MVKSLDMLDALTVAGPPCRTVGWRGERPVPYEELVERVLVWRRFLARLSGQRFALYLSDSLEFGSALFGAWQAGKTIFLPGDKLPATCAGLRHSVDGYLGEFEVDWEPLSPPIRREHQVTGHRAKAEAGPALRSPLLQVCRRGWPEWLFLAARVAIRQ